LALAALLSGCGGGGSGDDVAPPPPLQTAALAVTVIDTQGRFVDGATLSVASTGASATTAANGRATVNVPVGSEQLLRVTKAGFAEQVQLVTVGSGGAALTAMLVARERAVTIAAIENGGSASGKHGIKVQFPPGALVNAQGQPVSGTIEMLMTPLDTSTSDVAAFPGAFEGTASGVPRSPILTFGTAELVPQQNGQKLQLASGKTAVVELPLYATALQDGTPIRLGDNIALWSLNTTTGLWLQELQGTVIEQPASPTGRAVRATISHFSWWNLDAFSQRATVNVTVAAPASVTVPPATRATIEAQVVAGTGPTGRASDSVGVGGTRSLTVAAPGSVRFEVRFETPTHVCSGSATVSVSNGQTVNLTVTPSCSALAVPTIVQPATQALSNGRDPLRVQVIVDGPVPDTVALSVDGQQVVQFGPQFFYVHQLDTTSLTEGSHQIVARATQGSNGRNSAPVTLIVDRTAPRAVGVLPQPGSDVGRNTTFSVSFDEPVTALPFTLADVVKLTVTPIGSSTPQSVAATVSLSSDGTTLTVQPTVAFPLGTVGLSWGGLRDAAGNAVSNLVAATWAVDRSTVLGAPFSHDGYHDGPVRVAIASDGTVFALRRLSAGSTVELVRYDSSSDQWLAFGPPANDRPYRSTTSASGRALMLALDAGDVPHVVFSQLQQGSDTAHEVVLKRLVNGTWQQLGQPIPTPNANQSGDLLFDLQGRPVFAFGSTFEGIRVARLVNGNLVVDTFADGFFGGDPSMAMKSDGTLVIAYNIAQFAVQGVNFRQFVGGAWSAPLTVPGSAPGGDFSTRVTLVDDVPWIGWIQLLSLSVEPFTAARMVRFVNGNFENVPVPATNSVNTLGLTTFNGQPVMSLSIRGTAFDDVVLYRHDGTGWSDVFSAYVPLATEPAMHFAVRNGRMVMVLHDYGTSRATVQSIAFP
jgi:hypothetical protein